MNIKTLIILLYFLFIFGIILLFPNFNKNLYQIRKFKSIVGKPNYLDIKIIHKFNDILSEFEIILKKDKIINPLHQIPLTNKLNYWMINQSEKFSKKNYKLNSIEKI